LCVSDNTGSGTDFIFAAFNIAFIADDMGLGKTVQSIAAMSAYAREWPVLVLCPASARFNWAKEFFLWLGKKENPDTEREQSLSSLSKEQIQVLEGGKDEIDDDAKIIVCSYSLIASFIDKGKIKADSFKCIIADESHMLKNIKAKRTAKTIPILKASKRCILLSGTPAFKNPQELYPQLHVLGGDKSWEDEKTFKERYCYKTTSVVGGQNLLDLHLLMSKIMIRRKKSDVLKDSLPEKKRDLAHVTVSNPDLRKSINRKMDILLDMKGNLGKVARLLENGKLISQVDSREERDVSDELGKALQMMSLEGGNNDDAEDEKKSVVVHKLFEMSGRAKVPVVIGQLKNWLNEREGKIIVFAHHHSVLDAIQNSLSGLKTIRIDGKTIPKVSRGVWPVV
jgi:SWI/SNF-related matrix-associated actin-dependent regulator 1 of chromatin subfamily A